MKNERIIVISNTLKELGISPSLEGYTYLREALELAADNITLTFRGSITKILYPTIAKKYHTKVNRVERAIRYAIDTAFSRNTDLLAETFKFVTYGRAPNGEFISTVADYLMLKERSNEQR